MTLSASGPAAGGQKVYPRHLAYVIDATGRPVRQVLLHDDQPHENANTPADLVLTMIPPGMCDPRWDGRIWFENKGLSLKEQLLDCQHHAIENELGRQNAEIRFEDAKAELKEARGRLIPMKIVFFLLGLFLGLLLASVAHAQGNIGATPTFLIGTTAPPGGSGQCSPLQLWIDVTNSNSYACGSPFVATGGTWYQLNGGGGGTGTPGGSTNSTQYNAGGGNFGGTGPGTVGQICIAQSSGPCVFADPVVSQPTASLLNATVVGAGSAGTPNAGVVTVQGVASMTKLLVTPDSVALPANQSVNVAQVNGITTLTGAGATGTGSQRSTVAQDTTTIAGAAPGTAGSASANVVTVQGVTSMTPLKVDILGNAAATLDQAPGSAVPTNALQIGETDGTNTRVPFLDPCGFSAWTYYPINVSANTQIVAGSSSKNVYLCEMFLAPAAAAANVNIEESATSNNACATSPTGMLGGATAALGAQLSTNGGFVLPPSNRAWAKTATAADAMCIFASAQVTGVLAYVQF